MTESFRQRLDAKLRAYRDYAATHPFTACRLVHYVGDHCNAISVPLDQIEMQIEGCFSEGLHIDWANPDDYYLYLRVYEGGYDCEPQWDDVFAERDMSEFPNEPEEPEDDDG